MRRSIIAIAAYILILFALGLSLWYLLYGGYLEGNFTEPDPKQVKEIQPFMSGLVLPLFTLGSTLLVIANLQSNTIQNFSNNFFKLIDQHHKLVDNINSSVEGITAPGKSSKGREFFDDIAFRIASDFEVLSRPKSNFHPTRSCSIKHLVGRILLLVLSEKNFLKEAPISEYELDARLVERASGKIGKELLLIIYDHYYHIHQSDLGHYFRNLYHIVKFVEKSPIGKKLRITYIKMLRAQLSNYEILLLGYNALHAYGKKFYPFIEKYELLKNLNDEKGVPASYERRIVDLGILIEAYPHLKVQWNKNLRSLSAN